MAGSDQEYEKTYRMSTWITCALISWSVAVVCVPIWIVDGVNDMEEFWPIWMQFLTVLSVPAGAMFFVIGKNNNGKHDRKTLVSIVILLLGIFVILPVGTLALVDDGSNVYSSLKFTMTFVAGSYVIIITILMIQHFFGEWKGFRKISELSKNYDELSFWGKGIVVFGVAFVGVFTWGLIYDQKIAIPIIEWGLESLLAPLVIFIIIYMFNFFRGKSRYWRRWRHRQTGKLRGSVGCCE